MKVNPKFLIMMAALAAGTASAATTTTTAGTVITNTATASYSDPSDSTTKTTNSNTVSTTVLPKPDFDIRFDGNTPLDGTTQNAIGTTTKKLLNAVPGQAVETIYTAINLGNAPLRINLSADQTGAATGQTVKYYPAGTTSFIPANEITFVDVAADNPATAGTDEGLTNFIQRVVVPLSAAASSTDLYGASPAGTVTGTGTTLATNGTVTGNGYVAASVNQEEAKAAGNDLQFQAISMFVPNVNNNPNPPTTPPNPVNPPATPPTGPVNVPTLPVGADPTPNTPPVTPATPGYTDPNNANTPITVDLAGDIQKAYPKADTDNLPDVVTFTNALTNNSATQADTLQLFPTGAVKSDGTLNTGWTFDAATATFTKDAGLATETKVQFLNTDGTVVTVKAGAVYPTLNVPANSTAYYQTKVTYPDPDDSLATPKVVISVDVDSTKDALFAPEAGGTTVNEIYPAAAQFGDSTAALGAVPAPAPVEKVTPTGGVSGGVNSPADTDPTASFPMDLVNNGQYNDSFILSATTSVPGATVRYFYANGTELTKITTGPDTGKYVSDVVGAGTELKVYAVVDVPTGTATGDYTVSQSATGYFSTIVLTDTNDIIRVTPFGKVGVAKFVAKSPTTADSDNVTNNTVVINNPANFTATAANGAKPGDSISYRIIAKNTYNAQVASFFISDAVPANTVFISVGLTTAPTGLAKTIYSTDGTTWSLTMPTAGAVAGTVIYVAVDNDGSTGGLAPSPLLSGATLSADFVVTVK